MNYSSMKCFQLPIQILPDNIHTFWKLGQFTFKYLLKSNSFTKEITQELSSRNYSFSEVGATDLKTPLTMKQFEKEIAIQLEKACV